MGPVKSYDAVVKVSYGEKSFLFPGDAEYESEQDMLKAGVDLSADVLAVGHHGSNSSSNTAFLKKVNPQYGVIQIGSENRYSGSRTEAIMPENTRIISTILPNAWIRIRSLFRM